MSLTINGVVCQELVDGLTEGIHEGGPYATKKYLCDWANRYQLANGMLGLVSGTGGAISLFAPQQYPQSLNMWAREVYIEGAGQPTQGPAQLQFPKAVVTVNYGVPKFGILPTPSISIDPSNPIIYATQEIDIGMEQFNIPASAVQVLGPTAPLAKDVPVYFARAEIAITLHRFPWLPAPLIFGLVGNLNSAKYLGCDVGKLRFNGGRTHLTASTDGTQTQDVTLSFSYRNVARWDYTFHPNGTSGWVAVEDRNSNSLYTLSDLSVLIPSSYYF